METKGSSFTTKRPGSQLALWVIAPAMCQSHDVDGIWLNLCPPSTPGSWPFSSSDVPAPEGQSWLGLRCYQGRVLLSRQCSVQSHHGPVMRGSARTSSLDDPILGPPVGLSASNTCTHQSKCGSVLRKGGRQPCLSVSRLEMGSRAWKGCGTSHFSHCRKWLLQFSFLKVEWGPEARLHGSQE